MNRYLLFLMLVVLQANIASALPNPIQWVWGLFRAKEIVQTAPAQPQPILQSQQKEPYYRWPEKTMDRADASNYIIDRAFGDNLNKEERANVAKLKKDVCDENLRKFMNQLDRIDNETMREVPHEEVRNCLECFAIAKTLSQYKNYSQEEEAILREKAASKIREKLYSGGSSGDVAYLVKGFIGEDVFKNAKKLCDEQRESRHKNNMDGNNEIIQRAFGKKLSHLKKQQWENAEPLNNLCNEYLQDYLNGFHYGWDTRYKKAETAVMNCIAEHMRTEAEDEYTKEDNIKEFDRATRRSLGLKAFQQARNAFDKNTPGDLLDLFKKPLNKDCLKRTKMRLYERLGINKQTRNKEE